MKNWSDGYMTDLPYTRNFIPDLSPVHLRLVCSLAGFAPPPLANGFDYCELGCGQGLTTTLLAASLPQGRFFGVDFNPTHISLAQTFAQNAGVQNLTFIDASFADLLNRNDLPAFDYITLHGIYSWVSREQQQNIIRFIHDHLKPGGVVYLSYNAKPGNAGMSPIRKVFKDLVPRAEAPLQRVAAGFSLLDKLARSPRGVFLAQKDFPKRVLRLRQKDPRYVAHEFLNDHWNSYYCTEVFEDLADAKLTYVGSTDPGLNFDALSVPATFQEEYWNMQTLEQRQLFRDLLLNTSFRHDVYIRGPVALSAPEQLRVNQTIVLGCAPFHREFEGIYTCGAGEVDMTKDEKIPRIYEQLRRNPMSLADLLRAIASMTPREVMNGVRHLLTSRQIHAVASCDTGGRDISRINRLSLDRADREWQGTWLGSGHLGSAVRLPPVPALILKAHLADESRDKIPSNVTDTLMTQNADFRLNNQKVTDPGRILEHTKTLCAHFPETLAELERLGIFFPKARL